MAAKPISSMSVDDVAEMLEGLALGGLAPAFKANGVDGPYLLELTEEDLAEHLGAKPLQIRKLKNAIADSEGDDGAAAVAPPPIAPAAPAAVAAAPAPAAPAAVPVAPAPDAAAAAAAAAVPVAAAAAAVHVAAAPVAPPPPVPVAPVAPPPPVVPHGGPTPGGDMQAHNALQQALNQLDQARQLLGTALGGEAVQLGVGIGRRRRTTAADVVLDASQSRMVQQAQQLVGSAAASIQHAQQLAPGLPPIEVPTVQKIFGVVGQTLTNNTIGNAIRTSKLKSSREAVVRSIAQVQGVMSFLAGRMHAGAAHAHAHAPVAPPPVAHAAPPPAYAAPPPQMAPPPQTFMPPPQPAPAPAAKAGVGGAAVVAAALLGARAGRRRR